MQAQSDNTLVECHKKTQVHLLRMGAEVWENSGEETKNI